MKIKFFILTAFFVFSNILAQPQLKIFPDTLTYPNEFERLQNLFFINEGNENLIIDSVFVYENVYFFRYNNIIPDFPIEIAPGDTVEMDCIFWNYLNVTPNQLDNSILIFSNDSARVKNVPTVIDFAADTIGTGQIEGFITDENNSPLENVSLYFYKWGVILFDSVLTDSEGHYNITLPAVTHSLVAEKPGFFLKYFENKFGPLNADFISVTKDSVTQANFSLTPKTDTELSISGSIIDKKINALAKRKKGRGGVVVVRSGSHTPSKLGNINDSIQVYTGFIDENGTYEVRNIQRPGYYFIQAITDFYLPSYYSNSEESAIFWQDADSVLVSENVINKNIYIDRDSATGDGKIFGKILSENSEDFEDIIVYAQSIDNNTIFAHNFVDKNGNFKIFQLPFGRYRVIAQRIGLDNSQSETLIIDQVNITIKNVEIQLTITSVEEPGEIPNSIKLFQNYPNPFNPATTISFNLVKQQKVRINIYNSLGELVYNLLNNQLPAGNYNVVWNAVNYSSGVYFYSLTTEGYKETKKMLLLR